MNIIINGFHHPRQIELIGRIVGHFDVNYLLHLCDPRYVYDNQINERLQIDNLAFFSAGSGKYPINNYEPIDEAIIEKMACYESVVLKMMDRLEYYEKREYPYKERKDLYLCHLRYWHSILLDKKIDLYIGTNIPHEVYDYVLYGLAKIYDIPTYFFFQSQINDLIHPMTNWEDNCLKIPAEYARLKSFSTPVIFDNIVEKEWKYQKNDSIPFYMNSNSFWNKLKGSKNLHNLKKCLNPYYYKNQFFRDILRWYNNLMLHRAYSKVAIDPSLNEKYVYLALHYQPEMTTCPVGGAYVEQSLIVELLDRYLPDGINIYIKEHPKQENVSRGTDYYNKILRNKKRVFFVSMRTKSFDLIKNSIAVATVSGTVGWEALFRSIPVLLFGHNFYQYAPGVFMIKSNLDCAKAIETILANNYTINENDLKLFIQAVSNSSIKGIIDPAYEIISETDYEESDNNIFSWLKENISILK